MASPTGDMDAPLPVHPELTVSTLANGLTWWTKPHHRPSRTVALALHVDCGSLNEEDDERGFSHFLEHLAFHGSAHFPPGALLEFFESLGTRLGRHHNAHTGLDRTCFTLTLPDNSEATVRTGLLCLADFAFNLSLLPHAVEEERRVILEEMRARASVVARVRERVLPLLLPGSRIVERHPLGTEDVVADATAERLRAYYRRWYRPDRATLLVAGDVAPGLVERLVPECFAGWPTSGEPAGDVDPGIRPLESTHGLVIHDSEVRESQVRMVAVRTQDPAQRVGRYRERLIDDIAVWLVNRRFGAQIQSGAAPFRDGRVRIAPLIRGWQVARASVSGPAERIADLADALAYELHRVRELGFADSEVVVGTKHVASVVRQAKVGEGNRETAAILTEMKRGAWERQPIMSRGQSHELIAGLMPSLHRDELAAAIGRVMTCQGRVVAAIVPEEGSQAGPAAERLVAWVRESEARSAEPLQMASPPSRLMEVAPEPGDARTEVVDDDLGVTSVELANGVLAHIKSMEFRKNRVFVQVCLGGGRIREGEAELGLTAAAALVFSQPATRELSSVQVRDALVGRGVVFDSAVEEDAINLRVAGDPREIEAGLQLLHLLLTRPVIEGTALARWQSHMEEFGATNAHGIEVRLAVEALRLLSNDDPRFRLIAGEQARAITGDRAQEWLEDLVAHGPVEVAVVGDIGSARAVDLVTRYFGSLPARPRTDPELETMRRLVVEDGPLTSSLVVNAQADRAAVLNGWRAAPWYETGDRLLLQMAEQVLTARLQQHLRQERGLTYTMECSYRPSRSYPQGSLFSVAFYTPPARIDEAVTVTRELIDELAASGPGEAEMAGVRRQFSDLVTRAQGDPRYWCQVLADLQYHGNRLAVLKEMPDRVDSATSVDMRGALEKYIVETGRLSVVCRPA